MEAAVKSSSPPVKDFEVGVFCGKYQTEVPQDYFEHLDLLRGERKKQRQLEVATISGNGGPVNLVASPTTSNASSAGLAAYRSNGNANSARPPSVAQNEIGYVFPYTDD